MYKTQTIVIKNEHQLFPYCEFITSRANNMYNTTLFRMRQVMTGLSKEVHKRHPNEVEVLNELENTLPHMKSKYHMPTKDKWMMSAKFLHNFMHVSKNPDYYADGFPRQTAQRMITAACQDMSNFFASLRVYNENPSAFNGKPKLPGYKKSGGNCTVSISNQECVIKTDKFGRKYIKFPKTKSICYIADGTCDLVEVEIKPYYDCYKVCIVTDDKCQVPEPSIVPTRIISIDLGVSNLAAITNNIGKECLLFKGGVVKSVNQWYNKQMAMIMSEQTIGSTEKFKPTEESQKLAMHRDNCMRDYFHKVAKHIIKWCQDNQIDTIVIGENKGWKQDVNIGKTNNQNFVQIPFNKLKWYIQYRAEALGINVIYQDEAYTSKASFLDNDMIPNNKDDASSPVFSGKRAPTRYKGMYKTGGFRGLYQSKDGTIINSDLNGSANIGRKAIPTMFENGIQPNFDDVAIFVHPDQNKIKQNQEQQKSQYKPSKSKQRRDNRKRAS